MFKQAFANYLAQVESWLQCANGVQYLKMYLYYYIYSDWEGLGNYRNSTLFSLQRHVNSDLFNACLRKHSFQHVLNLRAAMLTRRVPSLMLCPSTPKHTHIKRAKTRGNMEIRSPFRLQIVGPQFQVRHKAPDFTAAAGPMASPAPSNLIPFSHRTAHTASLSLRLSARRVSP
jgi:hypothetical protein